MLNSLQMNSINRMKELFSSGQSGSFFFYSIDYKYVVKTIRKEEFEIFYDKLEN